MGTASLTGGAGSAFCPFEFDRQRPILVARDHQRWLAPAAFEQQRSRGDTMPRTIQSPDECRDGFEGVLACELLHIEPNASQRCARSLCAVHGPFASGPCPTGSRRPANIEAGPPRSSGDPFPMRLQTHADVRPSNRGVEHMRTTNELGRNEPQ
jgi:hypothetical protein